MMDLSNYPLALQILMQTDGTVTHLIKLLTGEELNVVKISENIDQDNSILNRSIYLQGTHSKNNWLLADSCIYLNHLPQDFIDDLLEKSIPIGSLWNKYKIETYKKITQQTDFFDEKNNIKYLVRIYNVFNQGNIIMQITEKFDTSLYATLSISS